MMDSGLSGQYYQQQDQHQPQQFPISSPVPVPVPMSVKWGQQYPSRVYQPTTSTNDSSSMKRGRVGSEESSVSLPSLTCDVATQHAIQMTDRDESSSQAPVSITPKRARSSNYQAPRSVKPSLLTAMGTLACGGGTNKSARQVSLASSVPTRRRLSGGNLDQFIGGHDKSFDIDPNRARSMSF